MKKPIMKKEDLDKEFIEVSGDKTCHIPLLQATKLLGLKYKALPTIKIRAKDLAKMVCFLENEKDKDLEEYQNHIFLIKEKLIPQDYPKVKDKLKEQFKPSSSKSKDKDVSLFTNNCIFLELDYWAIKMKASLGKTMPMILSDGETQQELTLH